MSDAENRKLSLNVAPLHVRLRMIGIGILLAGLFASAVIYFTAGQTSDNAIGYEIEDGKAYPILSGEYKRSRFELEKVGGKFAVVAAEMDDWFSSLWGGKQLGLTLAFLSVGTAAGCIFFAHLLSFTPDADQAENRDV
jgi:hypothetical protein